jgi:hypothetical protein
MSNRTDFDNVAQELCEALFLEDESGRSRKRIETELHDAFVAGQEHENKDLLAALAEALDMLDEAWSGSFGALPNPAHAKHIAELRAKFLEKT